MGGYTPEEVAEAIKDSFPDSIWNCHRGGRYKEQDTWCTDPNRRKNRWICWEVMKTAGDSEGGAVQAWWTTVR